MTKKGKIETWEERFSSKLKKRHGNFSKKVFHRLMKKSSTLKSTLKKRSKEYEVKFLITLDEIRTLFLKAYGKKCRYCDYILNVTNMVCDHFYPLSMGGESTSKNLQIICKRCNTRKGSLTHKEYTTLLTFLHKQTEQMRNYVLRKLAKGDMF